MKKKAEYKCLGCRHSWTQSPGPSLCPKCGYEYIEWTNYKRDFER